MSKESIDRKVWDFRLLGIICGVFTLLVGLSIWTGRAISTERQAREAQAKGWAESLEAFNLKFTTEEREACEVDYEDGKHSPEDLRQHGRWSGGFYFHSYTDYRKVELMPKPDFLALHRKPGITVYKSDCTKRQTRLVAGWR